MNDLTKAVLSAAMGGVIGWSGTALSMQGRVAAIEQSQGRIEQRLDKVMERLGIEPKAEAK